MFCSNCGTECAYDSVFCPSCGVHIGDSVNKVSQQNNIIEQSQYMNEYGQPIQNQDPYLNQAQYPTPYGNNMYPNNVNGYSGSYNSDLPSGNDPAMLSKLPKWNWGACLLHWIWLGNHAGWGWGIGAMFGMSILSSCSFGIGSLIAMIVLGFKGNEIAWKNRPFSSFEEFEEIQKIWSNWGIGLTIGSFVLTAIFFGILIGIAMNE